MHTHTQRYLQEKRNAYEKANALYTDLGEAWYVGERALAALAGTEGAHEPPEGSSLEADFKFAVTHSLGLMWEVIKPKLRVRLIPLNMEACWTVSLSSATEHTAAQAAYCPLWTPANGCRELVQNWHDAIFWE